MKTLFSGITEYSIFNLLQSPEGTGYQYFKNYALEIVENINKELSPSDAKYSFIFNFDNYFSFDSVAFHEDGVDYVTINDGVILTTFEVFYNILTHYPVLAHLKAGPAGALGYNLFYNYENQQYQTNINFPIDSQRKTIAEYMAMFAIKFMILHEIGHHYNGHVLYINSIEEAVEPTDSMLDQQTMEMDADAFAMSRLIDETLILLKTDVRICSILKSIDDLFVIFNIAIHTLSLIFKKENKVQYDASSSPYFSTFVRSCFNLDCAKTNILYKAQGIITPERYMDLIDNSFIAAEKYFNSLYNVSHYQDAKDFGKSITEHMENVQQNWKQLRKQLLPFARVPLAD